MRGPDYVYKKLRPREVTSYPSYAGFSRLENRLTENKHVAKPALRLHLAFWPRCSRHRARARSEAAQPGPHEKPAAASDCGSHGDASNLRDAALRGRASSLLHRGANAFAALFRFSGKLLACPLKRHICVKTALFRFAASTRLGPLKRHFCVKTGLERRMRGPSGGGM